MRRVTKGRLGDLTFQLNPTEITDDDGAIWGEINGAGMSSPISQYSYGKAKTYNFELYLNSRHEAPVDVASFLNTLNTYRKAKTPVIFAYMGRAEKVLIVDCPFNILALKPDLTPTEVTIPITLKRYE